MSDDIVDLHRNSEITNNQCPTEQLGQQQRQEILLHAVRTLKPPYRQVIVLMLEDFSSQEIAEILQISAGAVRVRINRAKVELKERLNHAN
jgi:RNA polymerase sigma-70 factor (ECF subfamily)